MSDQNTSLLQKIDAARTGMRATISALESQLDECDQRINSQLERVRTNLTATRSRMAQRLWHRRERLRARLNELSSTKDETQSLRNKLDATEARLESLTKQLSEQQARNQSERASAQEAREDLVALRVEETRLRAKLAKSRQLLNERASQLNVARQRVESLTRQNNDNQAQANELIELGRVRDELQDELADLKSKIAANQHTDAEKSESEDLRRRFELAVESVRSLKSRNEMLTEELNQLRQLHEDAVGSAGSMIQPSGSGQRNVPDGTEAPNEQSSSTLADTLLAHKDERIEQLEADLAAARQQNEAKTPRQESASNEDLDRIQHEWIEKQRAAEVEIAVERAQNARTRAELEEKMRDLEAELALARKQRNASSVARENPKKSGWLAKFRQQEEE